MADTATTPIVVSTNAGAIDAIQAGARYVGVIIAALIAVAGFLRTRDAAGLIAYVQANGGQVLGAVSGLIAIGTAAYGIFKSHKRGSQIATVAASSKVPDSVATTK